MKISLILAHPDKGSFNHAIAETAFETLKQKGHELFYHDLYAERFDPILPGAEIAKDAAIPPQIEKYCREISESEGIIIVHPNWWGQPPAILKGWIDRVIRPGVAYEFLEGDPGEGIPRGLLPAKIAMVFNTSNTPYLREKEVFGDPLAVLWEKCVFELCGVSHFYRRMFGVIVTSFDEQRREWLDEVRESVGHYF